MASVVNTFTEGMNKDVNSMVAGLDILTDALNATIVTYNGDEFVLQQDFGNGRVETAYLPKGYVPVGIKEYAGIIYVACYNPMNGLCQVGSFPSPERNISSEELSKLNNPVSFNINTKFSDIYEILSSDNIIRPGDKFSINLDISNSKQNELFDLIYNYRNDKAGANLIKLDLAIKTSDGNTIIITDKLKKVCIENGDPYITTTNQDDVKYSYKETLVPDNLYFYILEEFKYQEEDNINTLESGNKNYPEITGFWASTENMNDQDLDSYRKLAGGNYLNVFNNKIAGLLVLIISIPSIESFSASVDPTKDTNNNVIINFKVSTKFSDIRQLAWFGGFMLLTEWKDNDNEQQNLSFDPLQDDVSEFGTSTEGNKKTYLFCVKNIKKNNINGSCIYTVNLIQQDKDYQLGRLTKDDIQKLTLRKNEVISKIEFTYNDKEDFSVQYNEKTKGFIKYQIRPFMRYLSLSTYQVNDIIDISLIQSGDFNLDRWKWFTNIDKGMFNLRYTIKSYNTTQISYLQLIFKAYSLLNYLKHPDQIYNITYNDKNEIQNEPDADFEFLSDNMNNLLGTFTLTLYADDNFKMRDLYIVRIFVKVIADLKSNFDNINSSFKNHIYKEISSTERLYLYETRYMTTTSMFNKEYINNYDDKKFFDQELTKDIQYTIQANNLKLTLLNYSRSRNNNSTGGFYGNPPLNDVYDNYTGIYNILYNNATKSSIQRVITNSNDILDFEYNFNFLYNKDQTTYNIYSSETNAVINQCTINATNGIDQNIFDINALIDITETFQGEFSIQSLFLKKKFERYFDIEPEKKVYGFIKNAQGKIILQHALCFFACGHVKGREDHKSMIALFDFTLLNFQTIQDLDKLLDLFISPNRVYKVDVTQATRSLHSGRVFMNLISDCSNIKKLHFNIYDVPLESVDKTRSLDLSSYDIVPIFFIGKGTNTTSMFIYHVNGDEYKMRSAFHDTIYNSKTEFDDDSYISDTKYMLSLNPYQNNIYGYMINKLPTNNKVHSSDSVYLSEILGDLYNIYVYNDKISNYIYIANENDFKPYNISGYINIAYNVNLGNYNNDQTIQNIIDEFCNNFKDAKDYHKFKLYTILLSKENSYIIPYELNFKNGPYDKDILQYYMNPSLNAEIDDVVDNFDTKLVYFKYDNNKNVYNLSEGYAPSKHEFLNYVNILNGKLIYQISTYDQNQQSICKNDTSYGSRGRYYASWNKFGNSNVDQYTHANFYNGGYVIKNSTF